MAFATIGAGRGGGIPAALETEIRAAWDGVPLRDWARRMSDTTGVPVVVDLRLDPGLRVTLKSEGDTVGDLLERVASAVGAVVEPSGTVIRLVPRDRAGRGAAAEAARARSLRRLPADLRVSAERPAAWSWSAAARPRDLVADAAAGGGVEVAGLERIPHDHLPAASLPAIPLADRLDLVLANYDLRADWSAAGVAIVPIDQGTGPGDGAGIVSRPARPAPAKPRAPPEEKTVYSLRLAAPLDQAVAAVAKGVGLGSTLDAASLAARGIAPGEIVRVDARDLSRDELLDALVAPLGLSWAIDEGTLRVFAPPVEPDGPVDRDQTAPPERPSVHADRPEIDRALRESGVPAETLERLWQAVDAAVLPGMGSRLDGFLFQTRDPEWLALRDRFAEFLTMHGIRRITPEIRSRLRGDEGVVTFPEVASLDAAAAECLAGFGGDDWGAAVELPAVRSLSADAAAALARCGALLVLPSLEGLPPETAAALARHEGTGLVIGGFPRLTPAAAEALAECRSIQGLLLPDLEMLDSVSLARRLARQDSVFLPKVTRLSPEIAAALRGNDGGSLSLPGLVDLPLEVARQLAGSGYFGITLGCVAALTPDAAAALAVQTGPLVFTGPALPTVETAGRLDAHAGELVFQHVRRWPADVAAALAAGDHPLVLPAITALDGPDAVRVATILARSRGPLALPGLARITERALAALLQKPGVQIPAVDALEVVPDPGGGTDDYVEPR